MPAIMYKRVKIKKGDTVKVISGGNKGKTGTVMQVLRKEDRVLVESVNMVTKHIKATSEQKGQRVQKEAALHISNVAYWNTEESRRVKIGFRRVASEGGTRTERYDKQTGNAL